MESIAHGALAAAAGLAALALLAPLAVLQLRSRRLSRIPSFDAPRSFSSPPATALLVLLPVLALAHALLSGAAPGGASAPAARGSNALGFLAAAGALSALVAEGARRAARARLREPSRAGAGRGRRVLARLLPLPPVEASRRCRAACLYLAAAAASLHAAAAAGRVAGAAGPALRVAGIAAFLLLAAAGAGSFLSRLGRLAAPAWKVAAVRRETPLAATIRVVPARDSSRSQGRGSGRSEGRGADRRAGREGAYLPGQYAFLRFTASSLPAEEHPFFCSSSPSEPGGLSFTIGAAGDWSSLADLVETEEPAVIDGPYGSFSYLSRPDPRRHVFVAGGMGATPFLSTLNWMADRDSDRDVLFLWSVENRSELFAAGDLASFSKTFPRLKVVVVAERDPLWDGERGRVDRALLERLVPAFLGRAPGGAGGAGPDSRFDWSSAAYAVCDPREGGARGAETAAALRALGVRRRDIAIAGFAL